MSRRIEDLHPDVRAKAEAFLQKCKDEGIPVFLTQTYRTPDEQARIYAQGRTAPGVIVTNAPPGYSWHEMGRAFDIAFRYGTKASWEGPWELVAEVGEACGLEWGGRWKHPDRPHFEDRGGMTLAEARAKAWKPELPAD